MSMKKKKEKNQWHKSLKSGWENEYCKIIEINSRLSRAGYCEECS